MYVFRFNNASDRQVIPVQYLANEHKWERLRLIMQPLNMTAGRKVIGGRFYAGSMVRQSNIRDLEESKTVNNIRVDEDKVRVVYS